MQLVFDCISQSVRLLIAKAPKDVATIRVHGHSLGCHLAALTAAQLRQFVIGIPIEVYLWEPPRFFDSGTAASWNRAFPNSWAIKNQHDLVVTVPPLFNGFNNIAQDVWVEGGWKWDDLKVAHHLETGPYPGVLRLPS
jgi:acetyl esterase/lipase